LIGSPIVELLTKNERIIFENFVVKGNSNKTPNEISLSPKNQNESSKWSEAIKILC
jgi:hypothetical protein